MQAVVFCGVQATGKTSFYRERFAGTHVRLSLDMLRTRHREEILLRAGIEAKQPFVIDNTNPTALERRVNIEPARAARFEVIGFYFRSSPADALALNDQRAEQDRVPVKGYSARTSGLSCPVSMKGSTRFLRQDERERRIRSGGLGR